MTFATKFYLVTQIVQQMRLCDQSLSTLVFLWEKLSWPQFEWSSLWRFNYLELALIIALNFYTGGAKGSKLKSQKVLKANSHVCRSYRGKTGGVAFCFPSSAGLSLSPARLLTFHKSFHIYLSSHWAIFLFPG